MIQDETQMVPRSMRRQVPMIQEETEKDQKPEEVQISFSPHLRDSRRTIEKGSREGDASRAGSTSERFSSKKAPPDM